MIWLKVQKYDLYASYIPGKSMHAADALSRAVMTEKNGKDWGNRARIKIRSRSDDKVCTNQTKNERDRKKDKIRFNNANIH